MIHPMGRQIMNLFPLPDPALVGNPVTQGNYNYQFAGDTEKLRRDNVSARRLERPARGRRSIPGSRWARKSSAAASTTRPHRR